MSRTLHEELIVASPYTLKELPSLAIDLSENVEPREVESSIEIADPSRNIPYTETALPILPSPRILTPLPKFT
jgi:hypothetical protein